MNINSADHGFEDLKNVFKVLASLLDAKGAESGILKGGGMAVIFGYGEDAIKLQEAYNRLLSEEEELHEEEFKESKSNDNRNSNEPWLSD